MSLTIILCSPNNNNSQVDCHLTKYVINYVTKTHAKIRRHVYINRHRDTDSRHAETSQISTKIQTHMHTDRETYQDGCS